MIPVHSQLIVIWASDIFDSYPYLKKIDASPLSEIYLQGTTSKQEITSKDLPIFYHGLMSKYWWFFKKILLSLPPQCWDSSICTMHGLFHEGRQLNPHIHSCQSYLSSPLPALLPRQVPPFIVNLWLMPITLAIVRSLWYSGTCWCPVKSRSIVLL